MRPVDELSDDELREEQARTEPAYGEYVRDVHREPEHADRDLPQDARRHLDVVEELQRRSGEVQEGTGPMDDEQDDSLSDKLDPADVEPYA